MILVARATLLVIRHRYRNRKSRRCVPGGRWRETQDGRRRSFRGLFVLAAISLLLGWAGLAQTPPPPHVVLITIDTLRADRLEPYGYQDGETPHISALAREGVLFENALVQTPITLPSHASILTGTYPIYHGVQDVVGRLRDGVPSIAEWFQGRGYATAAWMGSSVLMSQWGLDRGFDFYEDTFVTQGYRQIDFSRVERPADRVVSMVGDWLSTAPRKPLFLWIHLYDPHDPYEAPEPYASRFRKNPYDGEIAFVDAALGNLFSILKERGIYEQSLIVLTADHGESLGEHQEEYHAYYLYDASMRIPLIFRIPSRLGGERIGRGIRVSNQVRSVDIAPTMLQLLGERVPDTMQGEGLVSLMAGKRTQRQLPSYGETHYPRIHFGWAPLFSLQTPQYKYIEAPIPELYDLKADPGELQNIIAARSALANQMKEELYELQRRYAPREGTLDNDVQPELDPETVQRLQSLGYVAFAAGGGDQVISDLPDPKTKIGVYNQLNRAIALSREQRHKEASAILHQVAEKESEMPIVHFLLGTEYFAQGMFLKAAEEFQATLERNPESNVARFNLARSYKNAGLSDRAEETLREVLEAEPAHFGARHQLASLLARTGRLEEAIREEEHALNQRPTFADGHNDLGSYYLTAGHVQEATASYRRALELEPRHLMAGTNLSLAYLRLKDFQAARAAALSVLKLYPRAPLAHYYLGQAYLGLGDEVMARAAFEKAKQIDPKLEIPR